MQKAEGAARPRKDAECETRQPPLRNADKADKTDDRDLVHGEGGTIGLPTRPEDLGKED